MALSGAAGVRSEGNGVSKRSIPKRGLGTRVKGNEGRGSFATQLFTPLSPLSVLCFPLLFTSCMLPFYFFFGRGPSMSATRGLIFDCDGTLADTMPAHFLAWTATLKRYGLSLSEERFYQLGGVPSHRIVATLSQEQGIAVDPQEFSRDKENAFLIHIESIRPIEPVVEIARRNRGVIPMAVASGGFRPVITRILSQVGILDWFDTIVTAEDTERHKPDPDVFLEAARRLNLPPSSCLVYEDTDVGLEAARRAGMKSVDVRAMYADSRPSS